MWRVGAELVVALDERFGEPVDAYVNGSQVWLRDDGPGGTTLEWRLHPVPGFARPVGCSTYDLFSTVALALAEGADPPAPPAALWDGLEAFPAFPASGPADELEPATLAAAATEALGTAPDAAGLVDHGRTGDAWEASDGRLSVVDALLLQLAPDPDPPG
ncbi:hypothetical protein BH18ACT1_BH18ACT1_10990 [soil metagenome]